MGNESNYYIFLDESAIFGRSGPRGILFTIAVAVSFYWLMLYFSEVSEKYGFKEIIVPFLKFLNTLRHFETESIFTGYLNITFSLYAYIIDFIGRIFIAYGIYQTVQAFRRYGKR